MYTVKRNAFQKTMQMTTNESVKFLAKVDDDLQFNDVCE